MMLRQLSIRSQLILFIILALLMLVTGLEVSSTLQEQDALINAERERSTVLTTGISSSIEAVGSIMTTLDEVPEVGEHLGVTVRQNKGIDFIAVVWPNGQVIFHSDPTYKGQTIDAFAGLPGDKTTRVEVPDSGATYLTSIAYDNPVAEGSPTYNVIVGTATSYINDPLMEGLITSLLIALGAAVLIGMALIYLMENSVSTPIRRVSEGAIAFSKGDLTHRIKVGGSREFGVLAETLNDMADQLTHSQAQVDESTRTLEERIVERTRDLFLTIEVGQLASSIFHQDPLLRRVTDFILEQFKLYYVQVYLLDDTRQYALLQFGTGEVGKNLMSYRHRLSLNDVSIVSRAATSGLPVLVADTETSDIHLKNPLLPATRSEVAIPLSVGGQVLGVLDLQADRANTFNADNLPVFEAMANQLTASLRGAQAYEAAERAVNRADAINRRLTYETWESYLGRVGEGEQVIYHYDLQNVTPFSPEMSEPEPSAPVDNGKLATPIVLRGESIGNIVVAQDSGRDWTDDDRLLVKGVAERLALTIEQYRSFDETQVALRQTAQLYQASRRIGTASDLQEIVATVAEAFDIQAIESGVLFSYERDTDGKIQAAVAVANWNNNRGRAVIPIGTRFEDLHMMPGSKLALSPEATFVEDTHRDPRLDSDTLHIFDQLEVAALIYLPLWIGGRQVGTLSFESSQPYIFSQHDLQIGTALAQQAAFAIDNRSLFEQMQRTLAETSILYQASRMISTANSEAEVIEAVVNNIPVEGLDRVLVALIREVVDGTPTLVEVVGVWDRNGEEALSLGNHFTPENMPLITVIGPQDIVLVNDFDNPNHPAIDPRTQAVFRHQNVCSAAIIPIVAGQQMAGWLLLEATAAPHIFTDRTIAPYLSLVDQTAVALQSHRLFEEAQHQALELQSMAEVSVQSSTILDVNQLLWTVSNLAQERFGFYHVQVYLIDSTNENLLLQAGSGSAGRQMVDVAHRISLGHPRSLVARAARTGDPVVVNDVNEVADFLPNPMLPYTESEVAIPLIAGGGVIGVLDIQAAEAHSITESDVRLQTIFAAQVATAVHNARLFAETQRRAVEVQTVAEVGIQASTILDVDELLWTVSDLTKENFGLYHVHIYMLDPDEERLALRAGAGDVGRSMVAGKHNISLNHERSLVARAARTKQSVIVNDVRAAPDFLPNPLLPATHAEMAIPMIVGDQLLGVLDVQSDKVNYFTEGDARIQATLAAQIAVTVQNARLFEQTNRRAAELRTVAEVSAEASTSLDPKLLLKRVSDLTKERFGLYHAHIYLLDDEESSLVLAAGAGQVGDIMTTSEHRISLQRERSLVARAARTRQPVIVNNVRLEENFLPNPLLPGTRAEMAVPMIAGDQLLGVLDVQADQENYFRQEDVQIQTTLASQIAISVANARLFSQTQSSLAETALLYVASRGIAAAHDPQALVAALVESVNIRVINRAVLFAFEYDEAGEIEALKSIANWYRGEGTLPTEIGRRYDLGQFPTFRLALGTDPVYYDDALNDERIDPQLHDVLVQQNILSIAVLPLWFGDRQIGSFYLEAEQVHRFTDEEIRPFSTLANQAALALNGLQLLALASQRAAQLQTVAEVGTQATTNLDLNELLQTAVDLTKERFDLYHAHVYLLDETNEYLLLSAGAGEVGRRMTAAGHRIGLNNERSLVARAARTRQSVIVNDVTTVPDFLPNPFLSRTRAEMALPLIAGNEVIGVLDVQAEEAGRFTIEDIQIKTTLASQIAVAVTNARSFAQEIAAEQALLQANLVVESSPAMLFKWDVDASRPVLYVSDNVKQVGYDPNEFLSGEIAVNSIIHPDDRARVAEELAALAETGAESVSLEYRITAKDGQPRWVEARIGVAERDNDGSVTAYQGLFLDVTERERTSYRQRAAYELGQQLATLLDANELLSETVNRLSDAFGYYHAQIYLYDETREVMVMREGLGQAGEIMKMGGHSIPLSAARSLVARAARSLEPVTANDVNLDPDHLPNPLLPETRSEVAVPLFHGQELIGVLDMQHNIADYFNEDEIRTLSIIGNQLSTALANARLFGEIQLEAERRAMLYDFGQRLSETLDPAAIADVVVENATSLLDIPEATLFRYDSDGGTLETLAARGELGQKMVGRVVSAAARPDILRVIARQEMEVITNAADQPEPEYDLPRQLGLTAWLTLPIAVADQVIGVLSLSESRGPRDFTRDEILLAQNIAFQVSISLQNAYLYFEQVQITDQLREVDRLKSEFLASMSHELRTPLNSIIGYAEVLLDGIDGELTGEMEEDITAIHGSGKHLLNLINDILDLAKIEAGQMDLMTEPVNLKPFVDELLTTTSRVLIMGKPVEMITDIADSIPQIIADPLRLRQVVSNLITNAIKFTEQGSITVRAELYEPDPSMIHMSVIDTGIGITAENLPLIFDRFRQVDQSATRRVGGTGLGLSITRQLIQMHGGDMWVESEYGHGSTFHFTLPIRPHEATNAVSE